VLLCMKKLNSKINGPFAFLAYHNIPPDIPCKPIKQNVKHLFDLLA